MPTLALAGVTREGIPASPGIVIGPVRVLRMEVPTVSHGGIIPAEEVEAEIARFHEARAAVREQILRLQADTRTSLGEIEAQIFEPQLMMLDDVEVVDGTVSYIRENHLSSERAFEWRVLEWEAQWSHTAHPMVIDRINDLKDLQGRILRKLMGLPEPDLSSLFGTDEKVIVVARDLTPSVAAQLSPHRVLGLVTDEGTRTSHSSILTRSLHIPCVVSVDGLSGDINDGDELILDGRAGLVVINPTGADKQHYQELDFQIREWEQELLLLAHLDSTTQDGARIDLRANIDLPGEAEDARSHGARGIGLFRTEFLVVGRNALPPEEEQYRAYRQVLQAFPNEPVVIRTYDLGGDKFPAFLHLPKEENPFLGWRAIRLCLDEPDLFRGQLRALIRASAYGDVRIMLPMVTTLSEVERSRALIEETREQLAAEGYDVSRRARIGAMIETPAAALIAESLADHVDFFSIGTNDLVQYTLAVDRGSARLAHLYNPFHPAVVTLLNHVATVGLKKGIEVAVCGELAAHPLGAFMLIGMGIPSLSVGPAALAEIKKVIRSMYQSKAREAVVSLLGATTPEEILRILWEQLRSDVDLKRFGGLSNLWGSG
ncbi:MAG: phosphoenolpyruvate--protein phosphotransferase [Gemmatimonadota bacterium]|nr:phosphoenolpyruvate--protein phosphotransferase [Gemmatimonadota bacterium]